MLPHQHLEPTDEPEPRVLPYLRDIGPPTTCLNHSSNTDDTQRWRARWVLYFCSTFLLFYSIFSFFSGRICSVFSFFSSEHCTFAPLVLFKKKNCNEQFVRVKHDLNMCLEMKQLLPQRFLFSSANCNTNAFNKTMLCGSVLYFWKNMKKIYMYGNFIYTSFISEASIPQINLKTFIFNDEILNLSIL